MTMATFIGLKSRVDIILEYTTDNWSENYSKYLTSIVPDFMRQLYETDLSENQIDNLFKNFTENLPTILILFTRLLVIKELFAKVESILKFENRFQIIREIKFPPEYQQAGIYVLNNFVSIVRQKYPNEDISISIKQEKDKVIFVITTPEGKQEEITETLTKYGMVISGNMPIEELLPNPHHAMFLRQKLEMANLEVRHTRELLEMERCTKNRQLETLEGDVKKLYSILEKTLSSNEYLSMKYSELAELKSSSDNSNINKLIDLLIKSAESEDINKTKEVLVEIKKEDDSIYYRLNELLLEGSISGAAGNFAYNLIISLMNSIR